MKATLSLLAATALALVCTSPIMAQTAPPPDPAGAFVTVQPQGQWLAAQLLGQPITNQAGETIGNVNDLLLDKSGRIVNVVIGVGGVLGLGEKNVAVPFGTLSFTSDPNGKRVITAPLSRARLEAAPDFQATEKTVYMRAKESATETARDLRDKAERKIEELRGDPKTK